MKKRLLSLLLALATLFGLCSTGICSASAASSQVYYKIDMSSAVNKAVIAQDFTSPTMTCTVAAVSTIEAYMYGATSNANKTTIYNKVVSLNSNSNSYIYSWASLGYDTTSYSLQNLYDQLAQGYPVIIHRTATSTDPQHWAVCCGYTGSTSKLEESGFIMVEIGSGFSNRIMTLTKWKANASGCSLDRIAYRTNGISVSLSGIIAAINYPEVVHSTGDYHSVYGYITSNYTLTNVTLKVTNASTGATMISKSVTPNSKSYKLNNLDSYMTFSQWSAGKYLYIVTATDSGGNTKTIYYYFIISSSWPSSKPVPTATMTYNSNGGSGSMSSTSMTYGSTFTMRTCTFTRSGYTFSGWTVKRNTDSKWYCDGKGWYTESEISSKGYSKKVYSDGWSGTYSQSWLTQGTSISDYTLYAQWTKVEDPEPTNPFVDVSENSYYYDAVVWAYANGIAAGTDSTHFSPKDPCTRLQVVSFLWRAEGWPAAATSTHAPFVDIETSNVQVWASLDWAYSYGIAAGVDDTHFDPGGTVTRAQFVCFLWRAMGKPTVNISSPFTDVQNENAYYYDAVLWAYANGIAAGTDSTHFSPNDTCTRAQVISFIYRAYA